MVLELSLGATGCTVEGCATSLSANIVAELRGTDLPDEIVLIGGHIDSWDVGQGAVDDGSGAFAAWGALKLLAQLGLRARRTVRVVFWNGEEARNNCDK